MTASCSRVVGIGGGTGLSVLLAGLGRLADRARDDGDQPVDITAVVSVADDGGSTGKLRRHLGIPAVGDLRNCVVALAQGEPLWSELFQHRFTGGNGLAGHSLGNLIFAALIQRAGGLAAAVDQLAMPLAMRGRVLPVTEEPVTLCAELEDGEILPGESRIPGSGKRIVRLSMCPTAPPAAAGVLEAIAAADVVVFGPGSLYTSVVPNLLVDGVAAAIRASGALTVYVCNLTTQPGETDGFDAVDHLRVLEQYLGAPAVDVCLVNRAAPLPGAAVRPVSAGAEPVRWRRRDIAARGTLPVAADLIGGGPFSDLHDPLRLARIVLRLARTLHRRRVPRPAPRARMTTTYGPPLAAAAATRAR
jgi:uncharacterized cofD-like protein